jgi:hypothetical protein
MIADPFWGTLISPHPNILDQSGPRRTLFTQDAENAGCSFWSFYKLF